MESWAKSLIDIMKRSLNSNGLPIPMDKSYCTEWASGLGIPRGGDTVIYTSCLYQMAPMINQLVPWIEKIRGTPLSGLASVLSRFAGFVVKPNRADIDRANGILRNIARALQRAGINFGFLYEDEPYSGALLYEVGAEDIFREYFENTVLKTFRKYGVKRVITIDPHTHNVLVNAAPNYFKLDFEVVNYLDLLRGIKVKSRVRSDVVIHDSCLYARYLGKYDVYRSILDNTGIKHIEDPVITGKETSTCCGGPLESLSPELSRKIAKIRIENLAKLSKTVVTVCPICLANLSRNAEGAVEVLDINEVIGTE
ncbi:Fe-S oxidoreductase [Vulcanisaeta moutnovskia 768-28]|uniref:Fe-S oxidoreductase n=1 Tax=Vulcanisaeta moutnovskia (strain 768-28) TaxID=985053 RepID=F0QV30_VULM7|nr:(Fe-S)-binding protein [Vulcanisaeta moutnovskia]ADY00762.1 Fe-S oxidoreductase [Vulcanisaeta moutnovskia 768-28]